MARRSPKLEKYPAEIDSFAFDFSQNPRLIAGETITSAVVAAEPTGLTIGAPAISGAEVRVQISGGTADATYCLTCTITTSGGATIEGVGQLKVLEVCP
jgi:hypothetical protein